MACRRAIISASGLYSRSPLCVSYCAPEFKFYRIFAGTHLNAHSLPQTSLLCRKLSTKDPRNSPSWNNPLDNCHPSNDPRNCPQRKNDEEPPPKPGVIQRFKQMYRDYWYVLVPVHLVTSAFWMGSFYYMVRSGVDIVGAMEWMGVSENITVKLRESKAGYFALAYACYKVATPIRYTVTIGGTTLSIKWLTGLGWIKPVPSTERLKEIYLEKKDDFHDAYEEKKLEFRQKTEKMKERHSQVMDDMKRYKQQIQSFKKSEVKK